MEKHLYEYGTNHAFLRREQKDFIFHKECHDQGR